MPTFKLIVSDPHTHTSAIHELKEQRAQMFVGLKIGDTLDASVLGIPSHIRITGGSDKAGFPMRRDVTGGGRRRILLAKGPGYRPPRRGERRRKLVRGNTITDEIYQINAVLHEAKEKVVAAPPPLPTEAPKPPVAAAPTPTEKEKPEAKAKPKRKPKGKKRAQAPPPA